MEIAHSLRNLWRLRLWVIVVAVVALLGSVALTQNVSLFPPSLKANQGIEFGAAETSLLVDSTGSAIGDLRSPVEPLTVRTALVAALIKSKPVQLRISKAMRLPAGAIATSVTIPNPQNPNEGPNLTAGEQAGALVGQGAAYQIGALAVPEVPMVNIDTQAPNGRKAVALARATTGAVSNYLKLIQNEGKVPRLSRVQLRVLGGASGGDVNPGASRSVTIIAFLAIFLVGCFAILAISRIIEDIQLSNDLDRHERMKPPADPVNLPGTEALDNGSPPSKPPPAPTTSHPTSTERDLGPPTPLN